MAGRKGSGREEGEWQGRKGSDRGGRGVARAEGEWQGRKGSGWGGREVAGEEGEELQLNLYLYYMLCLELFSCDLGAVFIGAKCHHA